MLATLVAASWWAIGGLNVGTTIPPCPPGTYPRCTDPHVHRVLFWLVGSTNKSPSQGCRGLLCLPVSPVFFFLSTIVVRSPHSRPPSPLRVAPSNRPPTPTATGTPWLPGQPAGTRVRPGLPPPRGQACGVLPSRHALPSPPPPRLPPDTPGGGFAAVESSERGWGGG